MKNWVLVLFLSLFSGVKAQNYTFTRSTGIYSALSSATILENGEWDYFERGIKLPFTFTYWGIDYTDSIYLDASGTISLDDNLNQEIVYFGEYLFSRGGLSPVSYAVEGSNPGRILKIEMKNAGINGDTAMTDSINVQCWIYETTGVIEFHYGPGKVKSSSWTESGIFAGIINADFTKYIILEGNPANPTLNTSNFNQSVTLNGMPANGTIYRFTPGNGSSVKQEKIRISISDGQIKLPADVMVRETSVYTINGQLLLSCKRPEDIPYDRLAEGMYLVVMDTNRGTLNTKLVR